MTQNEDAMDKSIEEMDEIEALMVALEGVRKIHSIEREMLSRAIQALCAATEKEPEHVVLILSEGLDEGYSKAMREAYEAARVKEPKLYVPK